MKHLLLLLLTTAPLRAGIVALTLLAEARGEGQDGMAAVAAVINQRAINRNMSAEDVCLQRWQFSCWNGKTEADLLHLYSSKMAPWALYLERNITRMNRAKIGNADHYYADYIQAPYWARGKKPVAIVGKHKFYRLNNEN
jgi:hypothetical protein